MNCWLLVGSRIAFLGEEVADAANDGPKYGQTYCLASRWIACKVCHVEFPFLPLKAGCLNVETCCALSLPSHPVLRMPPAATAWASCLDDVLR
ncbi:hypothetical protein [Pluralibacter gergoviae]|uniref:Secreted protein n=1 Tax=Pluralibacter gergoviae TaxID=61647 RepID=A0AAW8HHU2_PLUGE|nr:hypothetical protein [Pluralibacter gergoviae]EKW6617738.1 hypothetical protein [Pluralibacter gergoviae]EKW9974067.1 hypothetical protein [Pluralibacter gergoviae]MDQ2308007.1 hypothetical protein [Pluralibacter gergoviae]